MPLTSAERKHLDAAVARVEAHTGTQLVVACVPKSDTYAELPWKAFACAASVAALAAVVAEFVRPGWTVPTSPLVMALCVLGAGAAAALAAIFVPRFARLFLHGARAEVEAQLHARRLFFERELFATRERCAVLLFVSLFERHIVVLPDKGVRARIADQIWDGVIEVMREPLARGARADAIGAGLAAIEAALLAHGFRGAGSKPNELPDAVIEEKGA
jgi:putative membrane protein